MKQAKITIEIGDFIHIIENVAVVKFTDDDRRFSPEDFNFEFSDGKTDLNLCLNWKKR